jgi:ABC-type lipoprotein release transport system permease subunit
MRIFVDVGESFRIAVSAIWANKARGALTTLGIIIGIVAVITTMTAFNGMQNAFRQGFASVGGDVLYVSRMPCERLFPAQESTENRAGRGRATRKESARQSHSQSVNEHEP